MKTMMKMKLTLQNQSLMDEDLKPYEMDDRNSPEVCRRLRVVMMKYSGSIRLCVCVKMKFDIAEMNCEAVRISWSICSCGS